MRIDASDSNRNGMQVMRELAPETPRFSAGIGSMVDVVKKGVKRYSNVLEESLDIDQLRSARALGGRL
jgi:hypothetical protein